MNRLAIIDGVRTPIGQLGGALKDLTAQALGEIVVRELVKRTKIEPAAVDEVVFGCCGQASDAPNIARVIALKAGLPARVTGMTVMRNCASGIQALVSAAQATAAGDAEVQIVGGTESMSSYPFVNRDLRFGRKLTHSTMVDTIWEGLTDPVCNQIMGRTAENLVEEFTIGREEQDAFAAESHRRAFRATREGRLKEEIVPVSVAKKAAGREVAPEIVAQDEGINPALNAQTLALYPAVFKEGGTVTPGNSCGIADGAGAMLVMSETRAKVAGLEPLGYVRSHAMAGLEPERMGLGPAVATPIALKKAGMTMKDVQLVEINEAFAAQVLACRRKLEFDPATTNVNGGAIALGHPVGFTGIRIVLTLLREMRRRKLNVGLATLCVGGGQGAAVIVEI
jgi:acetyl-CoA C-acetyltransferase